MASCGDDPSTLANLARLLRQNLAALDDAELVEGARQAEAVGEAAPEISGRLLAELHHRGKSWPEISRLTGISQTTCYRRAEPYLPSS